MLKSFPEYRIRKEMPTLDIPPRCKFERLEIPLAPFILSFKYTVILEEGIYKDREIVFFIHLTEDYPFKGPKVKCESKILHPNIDEKGNVCMEVFREKWSSAMGLQIILLGIYWLLLEFDSENALNSEVADLMKRDYNEFVRKARTYK
ncbi:Nedd8-conjugating enzyme Ubc12 [Astathelohania contejeani]|uniref:Nedd8-conjugating enzyme Ubc12 n=1 Tax=Astathelohania contejeani TaxID=164912 RepID=A0ABQ7HVC5_9MICR|nr:Nedd8-conjugating enzyme Ubc12 [Thelohania contejeani]